MRWNRIAFKLFGTIILLFLVVLLPLGFVINEIFSGFYYSKAEQNIDALSSRYADFMMETKNPMMLKMMAEFSQVKVYVVDADGHIIVDPGISGLSEGTIVAEQELQALMHDQPVKKPYEDPITGKQFLISGKSIKQGSLFHGGIYVVSSIQGIQESVQKVRDLLILSGVGALFLALGFTFVLSRKLSDPLIQMQHATRQIAKGELNTRVNITSGDEIGSLAHAVNDLAAELQRYRDTRSEFLANISHELRTPMTYLEGYAKVLKAELYETDEEKNRYLDIIYSESRKLTHLIQDLFDLSKLEEGKISFNLEWIDLTEVIENVASKAAIRAKEKGLDIEVDLEKDQMMILADGLRMEQIMLNLVDNAIRYTEKGKVMLQLRWSSTDEMIVAVEDTGIGISQQELPYIFERFYRVEKSRSREFGGTGLGLAIVKRLVELQGGTIDVTSEIGRGTRFDLRFQVNPEEEEDSEMD